MRILTQEELIRNINCKKIDHIYVFLGEDEFRKTEILNLIKKKLECQDLFIFDNKNFTSELFINDITSNSFFSSKKIVFIKNFNSFKKEEKDFVKSNLNKISNSVVVVINYEGDKKIKEVEDEFKALPSKDIAVIKIDPPTQAYIKSYIREKLEKKGKSIKENALNWLAQNIDSYATLKNEIEKILLYAGLKKEITFDDVISVFGGFKETDRFLILDTMLLGDGKRFLKIVDELIESGEELSLILNTIAMGLEKFLKIAVLQKQNIYDSSLAYQIGVFKNEINTVNLKFINEESILKLLEQCLETENTLKSNTLHNPEILIRNLSFLISEFLSTF